MKYEAVKNGKAQSTTGNKKVVFNENLSPRPVLYAKYSGYQPDRGTFQGAVEGDLIFELEWNRRETYWLITEYPSGVRLPAGKEAELFRAAKEKHPWLESFLKPEEHGPVFLPEEVFPKEEYLSVKNKKKKMAEFLKKFGLPKNADIFMQAPKDGLLLNPREIDLDFDIYIARAIYVVGSVVDINRNEEWWGSHGDGSPAEKLEFSPEKQARSNYAHEKSYGCEGKPGIKKWREYPFIVRIVNGAYTTQHYSWGHTIDVWENLGK